MSPSERAEIEARLAAATPSRVRNSVTLASEWGVTPGIFGKTRHMLSDARDDEDVILMVEHKSGYSYWHCSPPGFPDCDYAHGTVSAADAGSREAALAEAKDEALAALDRWRAEGTHDGPIEQAALDKLFAHAPADLRALLDALAGAERERDELALTLANETEVVIDPRTARG